ncbi:hypothetical protein HDU67_003366 [Dinochytrium kinnereticum]|nr:hypothetical protein HDU67_003366 [Dinochytrium kinnereticum]
MAANAEVFSWQRYCKCYSKKDCLKAVLVKKLVLGTRSTMTKADQRTHIQFVPYVRFKDANSSRSARHADPVGGDAALCIGTLKLLSCSLSRLLALDDSQLWAMVLGSHAADTDLTSFLDSYCAVHAEWVLRTRALFIDHGAQDEPRTFLSAASHSDLLNLEREVCKYTLAVLRKMSVEMQGLRFSRSMDGARIIMGNEVLPSDIQYFPFTLTRLMDVCRVFSSSNSEEMAKVLTSAIDACSWLLSDFTDACDFFVGCVRTIQKRTEKSKSGGKGKGKESSSQVVVGGSSGSLSSLNGPEDPRDINEPELEIRILMDALLSFEALVRGSINDPRLSDLLLGNASFLESLQGCYDIANIIISDPTRGVQSDSATELKLSTLALLDAILDASFFLPFKLPHSELCGIIPTERDDDTIFDEERSERLFNILSTLLHASQFDGPVTFLHDAPLLLDLEIEAGLGDRLQHLQSTQAEDHDMSRLSYLVLSLEQILMFTGNADIRRIRVNKKKERQNVSRQKAKQSSEIYGDQSGNDDDYIKSSSLISQVQDLFPELGEGFIEACLKALNNDTEAVIMKVLENNLPEYIQKLDRSLPRTSPVDKPSPIPVKVMQKSREVSKDSGVLSQRKNIFDNDEFDIFSRGGIDKDKVIFGKKEKTAGTLRPDGVSDDMKNAILNRVKAIDQEEAAAFEALYDDEYDDTYDSTDIKLAGTIELRMLDEAETAITSTNRTKAPLPTTDERPEEGVLTQLYASGNTKVFEIGSRKTAERGKLRLQTGLSDEQIEGWYKMALRDPRKLRALEEKAEWKGNQNQLPTGQTRWSGRSNGEEEERGEEEESEEEGTASGYNANRGGISSSRSRGRGGERGGRGAGRGGTRGGGHGKHNRRDGHSRKMARGMGGPKD